MRALFASDSFSIGGHLAMDAISSCYVISNVPFAVFVSDVASSGIKRQLQQLHQLLSIALPAFADYLNSHDSGNLYFCFRWLLIWFKREFSFEDTKRLWEVYICF